MNSRDEHIAFAMNYCQHYKTASGAKITCAVGCDIGKLQRVQTRPEVSIKWGPCIEGHLLPNVLELCPHWVRRSREEAEARADSIEASRQRMLVVSPVVSAWRKKLPIGKSEVITCPACQGRLHLAQSSYNGHVRGQCETKDCVSWIE